MIHVSKISRCWTNDINLDQNYSTLPYSFLHQAAYLSVDIGVKETLSMYFNLHIFVRLFLLVLTLLCFVVRNNYTNCTYWENTEQGHQVYHTCEAEVKSG